MDLKTGAEIQARLRKIEEYLQESESGPNGARSESHKQTREEVAELYEERELLIRELALAAWKDAA
ncbi:MAG: hypothetical protein LAN64_20420 [Acidobacteriia bacterium]|nr:hypothetical protein [Terriglobia bacterium]